MKYILLLATTLLFACAPSISKDNPLKMDCKDVGYNVHRCENVETVCYTVNELAISCQFKHIANGCALEEK